MSAAAHKAFQDAVAAFRARKFADAERFAGPCWQVSRNMSTLLIS
jgi:hypothetical protein